MGRYLIMLNTYQNNSLRKKIQKALTALAAGLFLLSILFTEPFAAPARASFFGFGIKDEVELGRQFDILVRSQLPLVDDPEVTSYVEEMLQRLLRQAPPQPFDFKVAVLRHNAVNAFAAPGGYLFIHTGLIMNMDSESEVAAVLAHEVAHATQRHVASRIEKMKKISIASLAVGLAGAVLGSGDGKGAIVAGAMAAGQSAMLSYSRGDEEEADQIGIKYLTQAGYSPRGMIGAFNKLRRKQWFTGIDIPTYLSTHPALTDRITELEARIANLPPAVRDRKDKDSRFLRIQALIISRYADSEIALARFDNVLTSPHPKEQVCLAAMGKAIVFSRQNKVTEALGYFDKALACAPDDELIIREAGRFHYFKGDSDKAEAYLKKAVQMNPKDIMAAFFYARLQADLGNYKESEQLFREVLRYLPQDSDVHEAYARVLGGSGQMFKAYLHLAYAYLYVNDIKKCRLQLNQVKNLAKTQEEKDQVERLEESMKARAKFL